MKEEILIKEIKIDKNEESLIILFEIYRPMTESMKQKFFIRCFDEQDLEQECLICCFEAVMSFDASKGKFGSYYKRKLNNRFISLIRKHHSLRRIGDELTVSIEEHFPEVLEQTVEILSVLLDDEYESFWDSLSKVEHKAFKICLGLIDLEEALANDAFTREQIRRAESRVTKKFTDWLLKN